ncbi:MAG: 5-fold beta-flower protein [Cytophaga sp.]|uniref:5-fold beta-flower protein n=1 Tax=Cytophaga sp. TaxID=29535 RepID=UPI003F7D2DD9
MKTIRFVIFVAFTMLAAGLNATAQGYKAQFPMQMDTAGVIRDASGATFATISKDSIIKNSQGEKIAFIDRSGNLVDANGKILGKAAKNGDFKSIDGQVEYIVKPTADGAYCEVYDKAGKKVLTVPKNYKEQASTMAYIQKQMCMPKK